MKKYFEEEHRGLIYVAETHDVALFLQNVKKCYRVSYRWAWREKGAFFFLGCDMPSVVYYRGDTLVKAASNSSHTLMVEWERQRLCSD